jgi:hypothetical protein
VLTIRKSVGRPPQFSIYKNHILVTVLLPLSLVDAFQSFTVPEELNFILIVLLMAMVVFMEDLLFEV